jgi:two-component system sensor kinase FixL
MREDDRSKEGILNKLAALRERLAEAQRRKSEREHDGAKFRGLLEAAPDAILIVDGNGKIALANPQAEKMFGYTREELLGEPVKILVPDGIREKHISHRGEYADDPRARPMGGGRDLWGRRRDGSVFPIEARLSPLKLDKGFLSIAIVRDVTDRKRMEEALRESRERLQAILDNTTALIYVKDIEGRYLLINKRCERLFHLSNESIKGKTDFDLFPREMAEVYSANDRQVLSSGQPQELEEEAVQDDGVHTYISIKVPLLNRSGIPYAVCGISTDITERKRAEERLRVKKGLLEEKVREMDDFIHVVSHDLKEPLRGIEAFSGFLLEDYASRLDEEGRRHLNFLKQSAVRMKDLIHDLLNLASIARVKQSPKEVDLNQVLTGVRQDLEFSIRQKNVKIRTLTSLPTVSCDPTWMSEVFKNLLSNAIKFNRSAAPEVEIGVSEEGEFHVLWVKDNGIGIDPLYSEQVFGLFERLHRQEEFEGTGAGLAICKKVIEGCGGKIWVESQPGIGSTFYFTLPKRKVTA